MHKNWVFLFILSILVLSCRKNHDVHPDIIVEPNWDRYVVDKIYDYNNRVIANYTYSADVKLLRIDYTDPVNNTSSYYEFTYENTFVKSIQVVSNNYPQSNYQIRLFYNPQGRIIRDESWKNGTQVGYINYEYDANKRISNLKRDNGDKNYFLSYDGEANIKQAKVNLQDPYNGATSTQYRDFKYDTHQKPDFGLGYVFQVEPLPQFGTEAPLEKNISAHNMTEYSGSGTQWIYTYNDHNLPATIETKWKGINTDQPMLLRLQYKKVQ
jgi:hypothetical protein